MNHTQTADHGQVKLRLPVELKTELQALAEANRRTLNTECITRLERTVEQEKALAQEGTKQ